MGFKKRLRHLRALAEAAEKLVPRGQVGPAKEPSDLVALYAEAWDRRDAEALESLFAEDADFINAVGLWWTSRTSIVRSHKAWFKGMFARTQIVIDALSERRLGDAALLTAKWRLVGQVDPEGEPTDPRAGVMSVVAARLDDGRWIGVHVQVTDFFPGVDTLVADEGNLTPTSYIQPADQAEVDADDDGELLDF